MNVFLSQVGCGDSCLYLSLTVDASSLITSSGLHGPTAYGKMCDTFP